MKIDKDISLPDFRDEMQHRVVKYGHRSRPVKEAVRFARKQDDPQYYQIAADKVHAQRQFHRQTFGPSKIERLVDFVTLGSLREVFVMMLLVVAGIAGVETVKSLYGTTKSPVDSVSVDELARRLGIGIDTSLEQYDQQSTSRSPRRPQANKNYPPRKALENNNGVIDKLAHEIARILLENKELRSLTDQIESGEKSAAVESVNQLASTTPSQNGLISPADSGHATPSSEKLSGNSN